MRDDNLSCILEKKFAKIVVKKFNTELKNLIRI